MSFAMAVLLHDMRPLKCFVVNELLLVIHEHTKDSMCSTAADSKLRPLRIMVEIKCSRMDTLTTLSDLWRLRTRP